MANTYSGLTTDLSSSPYFDDYDETRGYYRVIYNPSRAVQARELTQQQTILQRQISRFGENIFQEGSLVTGGEVNLDFAYHYAKISDIDNFTNSVNVTEFLNTLVQGATSGVGAIVMNAITGSEAAAPDTKTLYLKYITSGSDFVTKTFIPGELLNSNTGLAVNVLSANTSTGVGSAFTINKGVIFAKGFFVRFDTQTLIIDKYSTSPSCIIGLRVDESIATHQDDITLLDNARGSTNYTAPGADRLKLTPVLVKYNLDETPSDDFIELMTIKAGVIQRKYLRPQYAIIRDEMARRTYDQAGNFVTQGLNIRIREHLNDQTNNGVYLAADGGNTSMLAIGVAQGSAYVYGYDVENLVTNYIPIDKGIDYTVAEQQRIATNYGSYLRVNEVVGQWPVNDGTTVALYNTAATRITAYTYSGGAALGAQVGTAKLRTLKYESGVIGTAAAIYRAYLYDINMTSGAFTAVRSIYANITNADAGGDAILEGGVAVLKETNFTTTVYPIAASAIRKIRSATDAINTTYTFMKSFDVSVATGGTFTVTTGAVDEIYPFSSGALNSDQIDTNFVVNLNGSATVAGTGTITVANSSPTVTGVGTSFTTQFRVGDKLKVATTGDVRRVSSIANNTSLTASANWATAAAAVAYKKQYYAGDIIDFTANGSSNVLRSIVVTTSTAASFDMKETLEATVSATVTCYLDKVDAREKNKVIRRNRVVLIDCATNVTANTGPWDLGIPDIVSLNDVRIATSFAATTDGTSVLSEFLLDNGQRDAIYDHGKVSRKQDSTLSIVTGSKLLVNFDYFEHDTSIGKGYFSIDSYPIDDVHGAANTNAITTKEIPFFVSPTTGVKYDLRDSIDIRPTRALTANSTITLTGITTNPTSSVSLIVPSGGLSYSAPNQTFIADLSYYLPRKDLIVANKNGEYNSIRGIPSSSPITPDYPSDSMVIAVIAVAPYPSLPADIAKLYGRTNYSNQATFVGNKRYTMKDVGTLEQRIQNLEYYTSLSLLEKNTLDTKILDGNGLDRFKNGIIVDSFSSHAVGDIDNPDYSVSIDPTANELRPRFELQDVAMKVGSTTNVQTTGDLITLPYTHTVLIDQPYASSTRNAAGLYYMFIGNMTLDPSTDYWTDTTQVPDLVVNNNGNLEAWNVLANAWGTQWNNWQTVWTGTSTANTVTTSGAATTTTSVATTTSNQTQTGTAYTVSSTTQVDNYGTRIIDTSIVPYMRARTVKVMSSGLKPNSKMYAFFDGESVSAYMQQTNSSYVTTKTQGADLVSDGDGKLYAYFYLPSTSTMKFTVGTKTFRLTDSITNSDSDGATTTSAEGSYSAFGLAEVTQDTIVSTVVPNVAATTLTQSRSLVTTATSTSTVWAQPTASSSQDSSGGVGGNNGWSNDVYSSDPIAQSFMVSMTSSIPGIFVTKLDLFFATKDSKYGATISIREMDASGQVTKKEVPYSKVTLGTADINISNNGTVATTVTFPSPVFLLNNVEYAFVVAPEATNPNTSVWTAVLGGTDIVTNNRINSQPYSGVLFASSNDSTWSAIQNEDIKFKMYRASFNTSVQGVAVFTNDDYNFVTANTVTGVFNVPQETLYGQWNLTVGTIVGGTPLVGQKVRGALSGAVGTIATITSGVYSLTNVWANTSFVTEPVTFLYANNTTTGIIGSATSVAVSSHRLEVWDRDNSKAHLVALSGTLAVGEQLIGRSSNASIIIQSVDDLPVNLFAYNSSQVIVSGTSVDWTAKTTTSGNSLDANFSSVIINNNNETKSEMKVASKVNETANLSGAKSNQLSAALGSSSEFISPVINKTRNHTILVHNLINNDSTGENGANGGNAIDRYITQKITLADGQDAEDLMIYLTAYKPPAADIQLYFKILHNEDSDIFTSHNWMPMVMTSTDVFSSTENKQDFKDYQYGIPTSNLTGTNAEVQYINSAGITFTGYKYFAIKIVLLSSNSSEIPRGKSLRGIALQK